MKPSLPPPPSLWCLSRVRLLSSLSIEQTSLTLYIWCDEPPFSLSLSPFHASIRGEPKQNVVRLSFLAMSFSRPLVRTKYSTAKTRVSILQTLHLNSLFYHPPVQSTGIAIICKNHHKLCMHSPNFTFKSLPSCITSGWYQPIGTASAPKSKSTLQF